jgi:hypothetical protein
LLCAGQAAPAGPERSRRMAAAFIFWFFCIKAKE